MRKTYKAYVTYLVLTEVSNIVVENVSTHFTATCSHKTSKLLSQILLGGLSFQTLIKKSYSAKVSYHQNAGIW